MSNLNSLLESSNQWKHMQSDAAKLANKWAKTGLLEGLKSETEKNNMSLILENQAKQLVVEASQTGGGVVDAGFTAGQGEQWAGIALPLVRKVFGQIAAKEFVSVQPMSLPSGLVFFLDFQYGATTAVNNGLFNVGGDVFGTGSMYGVTDTAAAPTDGLYGAGKWTFTTNLTASSEITLTDGTDLTTASWAEVGYNSDLSASVAGQTTEGVIKKVRVLKTALPGFDAEAARATIFSGSNLQAGDSTGASQNLNEYNYCDATYVYLFITGSGHSTDLVNTAQDKSKVTYALQPADNNRGDFEDGNGNLNGENDAAAGITIPEINVKLKSEAIVAKTKKLKAVWTPEFAQDLNAYHSLDAEAELTSIMSEYIALEIDLEILDMLIENALTTEYWSVENNKFFNGSGVLTGQDAFYNTQGQWFQTLGTKVNKVSNRIHQLTLRGGANFMVCSPTIGTILESIPGFAATDGADADTMNYAFGIQKVGNLNQKYQVYKNPYMTENTILLGFKGSQFLETGATFSPYIPLIMTPLVYDPDTFTPRKGLLTRYAKKMLRPEYYAKIYVNGLDRL